MNSISSRTPEGWSNRCPVCGYACTIEPSMDSYDAPCPNCGHLLWFSKVGIAHVSAAGHAQVDNLELTEGTLPDDFSIAPGLLEICPAELAIENCVLPIDGSRDNVLVAMHDPSNIEKVAKLRFILNQDIRILHVDRDSLERQVQAHYGSND